MSTKSLQEIAEEIAKDSQDWFGDGGAHKNLGVSALGLAGEAGEVADIVKKVMRGSITIAEARDDIAEELIDVMHYWLMLCYMFGVDITAEYDKKREINVQRFAK